MNKNLFIDQIKSGDRQAIEVFVNENQKQVFSTCLAYVQNEHDAADLTQEVFIRAIDKIHQYKRDSKLSTWLIRIAINLSLNFLRDNKKRLQQVELTEIQIPVDSNNTLISKEIRYRVRKAIYDLPENQRKVFILSFYLELSYAQIAEITGFSVSAIESLLFRARKNLRELLQGFYNDFNK